VIRKLVETLSSQARERLSKGHHHAVYVLNHADQGSYSPLPPWRWYHRLAIKLENLGM
jgi:GTPase